MILADHCVYGATIGLLKRSGFEVLSLEELTDPSASDPEVLRLAIARDLVLLTNDIGFGNVLLYPPAEHCGMIVLKMRAGTIALKRKTPPPQ